MEEIKVASGSCDDDGSSSPPFRYEFVVYRRKPPSEQSPPPDDDDTRVDFYKLLIPPDYNPYPPRDFEGKKPPPDVKDLLRRMSSSSSSYKPPSAADVKKPQPRSFISLPQSKPVIAGEPRKLELDNAHTASYTHTYAAEAVKEFNTREFKDKLELVKVTKGMVHPSSGYVFHLTFDARTIGDEGTIKAYEAEIEGSLKVLSFKLINDGEGNEEWFWK